MAYYVRPSPDVSGAHVAASPSWDRARRVLEHAVRRLRKPAALRRLARLAPDENPLVTICDSADPTVVATHAALHPLGGPDGSGDWSRWGWEQISRVAWDEVTSTLNLIAQPPHLPSRVTLTLPDPGPLVAAPRDRVAWTTQLAARVSLPSGKVHAVARRHPLTDRTDWYLYPDATVDLGNHGVQQELDLLVAQLRAETRL